MVSESATLAPHPRSSPNVMLPRQSGLTRSPERPSVMKELSDISIDGNHGFRVRDAGAPSQVFAKRHAPKAKWAHAQSGTAQRDEGIERHIDLLGCEEWRAVIRRFLFHRTIPETPGGRLKLPASCII